MHDVRALLLRTLGARYSQELTRVAGALGVWRVAERCTYAPGLTKRISVT